MARGIGILVAERIVAALVENHELISPVRAHPEDELVAEALLGLPSEVIIEQIVDVARPLLAKGAADYIGIGFPGIVKNGRIEDSPNLVQLKGQQMQSLLEAAFRPLSPGASVSIFNDADVVAAGLAASRGQLDRLIRVWTLGNGIGYGRYPFLEGVWEGGHTVVTLDPKEQFCGCGGRGHLEGIMGNRSMRLRFMDLEPDEIFEQAQQGEQRCVEFVKLWHRALAAATATSIHLDGPGKFFITGFNAGFLNISLLGEYLHEMVKLSPLQGYSLEIVPGGEEIALVGAAVNAMQALARNG
jgi:predicted NBD/HSP70 family sugar kinase